MKILLFLLFLAFGSHSFASVYYEKQDSSLIKILCTENGERLATKKQLRKDLKDIDKEIAKLQKRRREIIDALELLRKKDYANGY